ncbi:Serine/threonine-protein kinase plo1 [Bienertia sinuspersici]
MINHRPARWFLERTNVGVYNGILRKQGSRKVKIRDLDVNASVSNTNKTNEVLKKENRELSMKTDENTRTLKTVLTQFSQILDAVRKGKASVELIDAAQSALHMAIPEVIFLPFLSLFSVYNYKLHSCGYVKIGNMEHKQ